MAQAIQPNDQVRMTITDDQGAGEFVINATVLRIMDDGFIEIAELVDGQHSVVRIDRCELVHRAAGVAS